MRRALPTALAGALLLGVCGGGLASCGREHATTASHRLDPYGVWIDLPATHVGGPLGQGSFAWRSGDGSSVLHVTGAEAGPAAPDRIGRQMWSPELLGDAAVAWRRPRSLAGLPGIEAGVLETAPGRRSHWVAVLDAPRGPVLFHLFTESRLRPSPELGEPFWEALLGSIRVEP